jgi:mRNA-degrading endonuclease toxin of MazEF toxin-antitoxin module
MIDKIINLPRDKIAKKIGALKKEEHEALDDALKLWLGF